MVAPGNRGRAESRGVRADQRTPWLSQVRAARYSSLAMAVSSLHSTPCRRWSRLHGLHLSLRVALEYPMGKKNQEPISLKKAYESHTTKEICFTSHPIPHSSVSKESACSAGDPGSIPGWGRFPWRRKWQPTPVFLPGESHGWRSLAGYSPCGLKSQTLLSD